MPSVYIVDDDDISRDWFYEALAFLPAVNVVTFPSGESFLAARPDIQPGVVLLDLRMPTMSGLDTMAQYGEDLGKFPTIVMSAAGDIGNAVRAMQLGAMDFIEKPCPPPSLYEKIRPAFARLEERQRLEDMQTDSATRFSQLSAREVEVLKLLIDGQANRAIADKLRLSVRTVEVYRGKLMMKLGVNSLPEAIKLAYASGFVELAM